MPNSSVLHFIGLRQPITTRDAGQRIPTHKGPFAARMLGVSDADHARQLAREFRGSDDFVDRDNVHLIDLEKALADLAAHPSGPLDTVTDAMRETLASLAGLDDRLTDSWLALSVLEPDSSHLGRLSHALRLWTAAVTERGYQDHSLAAPDLRLAAQPGRRKQTAMLEVKEEDICTDPDGTRRMSEEWVLARSNSEITALSDAGLDLRALDPIDVRKVAAKPVHKAAERRRVVRRGGAIAVPTIIDVARDDDDEDVDKPEPQKSPPLKWILPNAIDLKFGELNVIRKGPPTYVLGEVAHIENVLPKETRNRTHRVLNQIETTSISEAETTEETETSLETTERFELEKEATRLTRAELGLEVGGKVSASYGTSYSVEASAKATANLFRETFDAKSTSFAQEVVEKSVDRVKSRVRTEERQRILRETEETNEHGFDNDSTDAITGIYRWVDKLHDLQVVNYGKRLFVEFQVPDPARVHLAMLRYGPEAETLDEPIPLPDDIWSYMKLGDNRYRRFIDDYGVEGVESQPHPTTTVSYTATFGKEHTKITVFGGQAESLPIPPGYAAQSAHITAQWLYMQKASSNTHNHDASDEVDFYPSVKVGIGQKNLELRNTHLTGNPQDIQWEDSVLLNGETTTIPVAVVGLFEPAGTVTVEVTCHITPSGFMAWAIDTVETIVAAYNRRMEEYRERKAILELQQEPETPRRFASDEISANIEDELRRGCVELMMTEKLGILDGYNSADIPSLLSDGINPGLDGPLSETDQLAEPVRFFQSSFEWAEMSYDFHPYFWAPRDRWAEKLAAEIEDPLYRAFVRSGSARVRVPIVPGQEEEVLYFLQNGQFWRGEEPVDLAHQLSSKLVPIWRELQESPPSFDHSETEIGQSWTVQLPTSLVMLNNGRDLPDLVEADDAAADQLPPVDAPADTVVDDPAGDDGASDGDG